MATASYKREIDGFVDEMIEIGPFVFISRRALARLNRRA